MYLLSIIFGILIRFLLIPVAGFKADIAFWKGWGLAAADKGIIWLVKNTNFNYPPGFAYILMLINKTYAFFKNPYVISDYWHEGNLLYLFLVKIITIVADIGIVILLVKMSELIGKMLKIKEGVARKIGYIWAILYFLNPASIFDGVHWGQVDQFGLFLFLLSLYFLLKEKIVVASIIFTISFLMKFQNIIFIPLFFLFIYKKYSLRKTADAVLAAAIVFFIVIFPFWFHKEIADLIRLFTINADWFPWYSLNAFNIWWIAAGGDGMKVVDKTLVWGVISAKQMGFYLFSFSYLVAVIMILSAKKEDLLRKFLLGLAFIVFAFFHFRTQSHERYLFHILGFFPLISMTLTKDKLNLKDLVFYLFFSLIFFINMYIGMFFNYSDQVIWPFSHSATRVFTLYLSIMQITLFLYFIWEYMVKELTNQVYYIGVFFLLFIGFLFFKNTPYYLGKPISLTMITPIDSRQDYLSPVMNKSVDSGRGVFFWNRLSDNYYFYKNGIGSHAASEITYSLKGKFSRIKSDFGLDTEAVEQAKVFFIVEADGREIFRSKEKGRFDIPSSLDLNIKGVDKLVLKIKKSGDSNYGAHADWLNPVVIR